MKVLYATDGFPAAEDARLLVAKLFRREDLQVTVATVTHRGSLKPGHLMIEMDPLGERRVDSRDISSAAARELRSEGFAVDEVALEGHPGREIVSAAEALDSDLVVVGAGSQSWLGNRLLGSVSHYVLYEASCSILVVHDAPGPELPGLVLVGVDGSKTSREAVSAVAELLDPERTRILVTSVVPTRLPARSPVLIGGQAPRQDLLEQEEELLLEGAGTRVDAAVRRLSQAGFEVDAEIHRGGAASILTGRARDLGADLVAVGSRGVGPVRRTFLGSVSSHVARSSRAALVQRRQP